MAIFCSQNAGCAGGKLVDNPLFSRETPLGAQPLARFYLMSANPRSGPDPSEPESSAEGAVGPDADDLRFESDFAELMARFSAQTGVGLSAELSADLALEIVLHEIVEHACLITGASGAAIVLQRDGEMVCRASSGTLAPELGEHLDLSSGISAQCLQSLRTQRCDDVLADPHANVEASRRLGIRSVMAMPLLRGSEVVGVFELFSSRASAFGERDEGMLEVLAGRAVSNLERATEQTEFAAATPPLPAESVSEIPVSGTPAQPLANPARQRSDHLTTILTAAVIACAALLVLLVGRHFVGRKEATRTPSAAAAATTQPAATSPTLAAESNGVPAANSAALPAAPAKARVTAFVPPGGLVISENGKEVFRQPPVEKGADSQPQAGQRALAKSGDIVEMSPAAAAGSLLHRVEPQYPEEARRQGIQGAVVLDLHIAADGSVQDVRVASGAPLLAQAASDAVKQWRFRTQEVNGRPAETQRRVTLNFKIPSPD